MHRELTYADSAFGRFSHLGLYLTTALIAGLVALDLLFPDSSVAVLGIRPAMLAAILGGARALYSSIDSLVAGRTGADLALAIACIAAILLGKPLVAAEVIAIGLIGECLEAWTFARTHSAVRSLAELFPKRCWLLRDGQEVRVFTREVQVGDIVVVKPGAKVPVDGEVIAGVSAVDASSLTGESMPIDKEKGSAILAGSVNLQGVLTIRATTVGEQTAAGRLVGLTAQALREKSPSERTADRLARWFLPVVLGLALLTFFAYWIGLGGSWSAAQRAIIPGLTVLIVACPCALILATPATVIAALGRLARTGVLVKSGAALERLANVRSIAFDKTGTLTEGQFEVADVVPLGVSETELLQIAAAAEAGSEHPIGLAICRAVKPTERAERSEAFPGAGIRAEVGGREIFVGTPRLLQSRGIEVASDAIDTTNRLATHGQTPLIVARDGAVVGVIGTRDRIRINAAEVIAELRADGIESITMLTGDRDAVARAIGNAAGINDVRSELLPADKAEAIASMAFVGDGINDAPALARAAVGLAVGQGADIAAEAGDIVLMGDPLKPLPLLARLSRKMVQIIRQNVLFFGFGVNIVGVILTAWVWPLMGANGDWLDSAPIAGAIYHQIGSLAVLLNSMRLLAFENWPSLPQARTRLAALDSYLDPDSWLHALEHHWRPVAIVGSLLALGLYLLTGLHALAADEVGVVQRFGRILPDELGPGLHVRWPWPIESVTRLQPGRIRSVEIGFRTQPTIPGPLSWESLHAEGLVRIPDESAMMTGDGNLVELLASVRYRIGSPKTYLTASRESAVALHAASENLFREEMAARPFAQLLTLERERLARSVRQRLEPFAETLGLTLEAITINDLHPPNEVVTAYRDVARAAEARSRLVHEAEMTSMVFIRSAGARAQAFVREAEAKAVGVVASAAADAETLAGWQEVFTSESATPGLKRLVEFHLAWEALAEALIGRPKAIIDSDRLPGRRQLYFIDPLLPPMPRPEAVKP